MSTSYGKTISLSAIASAPPNVILSKLCSPSYSLWKLRSGKRRARGGSWRENIPGVSSFSCWFFWAPIKWIQVVVEGWKERLVFKGSTVCSQGRQRLLAAALSPLGMPVVAVLPLFFPNTPRAYWSQLSSKIWRCQFILYCTKAHCKNLCIIY